MKPHSKLKRQTKIIKNKKKNMKKKLTFSFNIIKSPPNIKMDPTNNS